MALNSQALIDAVASAVMQTGWFQHVNQHEPKTAPLSELNAAVWVARIGPARSSGLASTSSAVTMMVRIYLPLISGQSEQQFDAIDPTLMNATDAVMAVFSADFTLGGIVRSVDLIGGSDGTGLSADSGYLPTGDTLFRVMSITVPMVVNDVWTQAP